MAKKISVQRSTEELLQDLLIVQLSLAGVGQAEIRQIVGVDMHRVGRIAKLLKKRKDNSD